jgi:GT2 family glycosyltransferase
MHTSTTPSSGEPRADAMTLVRSMRVRIALARATILWRLVAPMRARLVRHKRVAEWIQPGLDHVLPRLRRFFDAVQGNPVERYRAWVEAYDTLDAADFLAMRNEQTRFTKPPLLSLVVPVNWASAETLEAVVQSLLAQVYERWELDFIGLPVNDDAKDFLAHARSEDARVRFSEERPNSLAEAWNRALQSAPNEFSVLVDPGVALRPHALFLIAHTIERYPDAALVYADDDVVDLEGARSDHYFKPDWNEALLCSQDYLGGLVAFRRSLALEVGGCRQELDCDCTWGLMLRIGVGAPPGTVYHLPFVLSHRRAGHCAPHPHNIGERQRGARALEHRLARIGRNARAEPVGESSYRVRYVRPEHLPHVTIVIPTTGRLEVLRPCIEGVLQRTTYANFEVLLVVNERFKQVSERRDYLDVVAARQQVRVLFHKDRTYNFSWANNWAVGQARGELVCFLNDDAEAIGDEWLSAMVGHILEDRVGAVGAMLYYPDERIQHAGVVLGAGAVGAHAFGVGAHTYGGKPRGVGGYHDRALICQDVSCVTAACMLVRRDAFLGVGGYDEALAVAFNDVDLCLRLNKAGWRIVWTPSAELYHGESVSIGRHDVGERAGDWVSAWNLMHERWGECLMSDPHYSPNLSLDPLQLWEPAFPPRIAYPWRVATHDHEADRK